MITKIFIKDNPTTEGLDYQYESKIIDNSNAFGGKGDINLPTE